MTFLKGMDIIFCCNVLIYFDLGSKRKVMQHFYSNLLPVAICHGPRRVAVSGGRPISPGALPGAIGYWKRRLGTPEEANHEGAATRGNPARIQALEAMPAVPAIVLPLTAMLHSPDQVDVEKVIDLVSYDGTIAAHCLRMANSPLFGRRNTETVRSAVFALGLKRIEAILLGCC